MNRKEFFTKEIITRLAFAIAEKLHLLIWQLPACYQISNCPDLNSRLLCRMAVRCRPMTLHIRVSYQQSIFLTKKT
jgi:hypothetical protein